MPADGQMRDDVPALESLLRWYVAMGVDAAVDDTPHDRFAQAPPSAAAAETSAKRAPKSPQDASLATTAARPADRVAASSADDAVRRAEADAAAARTLDDLRARWAASPDCGLAASSKMIFAGGNPHAALMVIGGAPDADDERGGEAFAGPGGRLLDAMLRAIGLDRTAAYLTTVVPWRPPGNRAPTPLELSLCLPYTRRHVELVDPSIILCLGERAAQPLLGLRDPIGRLRGRWLTYEGSERTVKTLVTFAPEYLLKQPLQKRRAWGDLLMVSAQIGR